MLKNLHVDFIVYCSIQGLDYNATEESGQFVDLGEKGDFKIPLTFIIHFLKKVLHANFIFISCSIQGVDYNATKESGKTKFKWETRHLIL